MPKGELVCEGCGFYESECRCDKPDRNMDEKLREQIKDKLNYLKSGASYDIDIVPDVDVIMQWVKEALPKLAKEAGYLSPDEVKAERERVPPVLSDEALSEMHLGYHVPTKEQWAFRQDHQYWRDRQLLTAQRDADVAFEQREGHPKKSDYRKARGVLPRDTTG